MKDTEAFLRGRGIQPSQQRIAIYKALAATKTHPSADAIRDELSASMPTLSRTTVYSTLELFAGRGIAQKLAITGSEIRYDADTSAHAHFRCRACGAVSDLPGSPPPAPVAAPPGYLVERVQLYAEGLCPACSSKPA